MMSMQMHSIRAATALAVAIATISLSAVAARAADLEVKIDNFTIPNTFFASYTLNGKPQCQFDYMGRFTVP